MGELSWLYKQQKYFDQKQLEALRIPTIFFYGSKEAAQNKNGPYARFCFELAPAPTYLVEIPNGNHFAYNSKAVALLSGGSARQFELINATARAFLDRHLLNKTVEVSATGIKSTK